MKYPTYAWQQPYIAAVCETDDDKMPGHILEAVSAIEQRLLSPVERGSEEERAIQNTQRALETLKAERCNGAQKSNGNGHY